jgi:hypothetical protein
MPNTPAFRAFQKPHCPPAQQGEREAETLSFAPNPSSLFVFDSHRGPKPDTLRSVVSIWLRTNDVFNIRFLCDIYFFPLVSPRYRSPAIVLRPSFLVGDPLLLISSPLSPGRRGSLASRPIVCFIIRSAPGMASVY